MPLNLFSTVSQLAMQRELPLSTFIPYAYLKDAQTFVTKNGAMGSVIALKGLPFEVSDEAVLQSHYQQLSRWVQSLPDSFAITLTWHRHPQSSYPEGEFPAGFAHDFNVAYRKKLAHQRLYTNDFYLTLMVKGASDSPVKSQRWLHRFLQKAHTESANRFMDKQAEKLTQALREAVHALEKFSPRVLGEVERARGVSSALLGFLGLWVNGHAKPVAYPLMDLSQYLPQRRVSVGHQTIEWQGIKKSDAAFGALLSVKQYGHETDPGYLRSLLSANFSFISTHSFAKEPSLDTIAFMKKQYRHGRDVDVLGNSLLDDVLEAMDGVRSEYIAFGWHHHSLLVMAETARQLQEPVAKVVDIYRQAELVIVRESLNLEAGFFAQMPGNFAHIHRRALISHENWCDFSPLHNYHHGYQNGNHLGSSLMLVESQGLTPLNLNLHQPDFSGNRENPTLGHTLMIAPPGSGKTTLLCALDAMSKKYQGRSFFFDRDRGCEIYVRAMGGFYSVIKAGIPTGFNPLQLNNTPENRNFLVHWLESLVSPQAPLSEMILHELRQLVKKNYTLPKPLRQLTHLIPFLPVDFAYKEALLAWCQPNDLAYLFDNNEDTFDLSDASIAGFDMTALLAPENKNRSSSVLMYLFHRMEALMTGQLMGIYLDEAWQFLDNPYWAKKLKVYLLTLRKRNVYVVFVAQLLQDVLASSLSAHLLQSTATQLFLSNNNAKKADYIEGAQLSHAEYHFIKTTGTQSRRFLFKQGMEAAIARLNLDGLEDFIRVFSGNEASINLCHTLREKVGDNPADWLPLFYQHFKTGKMA